MKKYKLFIFYSFIVLFIIGLSITIKNIKNNIDNKSNQIDFLKKNLDNKKNQIKNIHSKLLEKNINLENLIFEDGINFENKSNQIFTINDKSFTLQEISSNDIIFAKHPSAASSAYLDYSDNKIFLVTATGQITFLEYENFNQENYKFQSIKSNIQEIIRYSEFYNSSAFGIKDILINNGKIYVSYIKKHYDECFSTSILKGTLNYEFIFFEDFYSPDECIKKSNDFYNSSPHDKMVVHQSGGRIIVVNNDLIFTTGEFRYRILAQDKNSDFGKIISINLSNKSKKIISMGHRNPQGLYYSRKLNKFFTTEHGPSGGDEVNFFELKLDNKKEIPNFGWPISSYGRHYFDNNDDNDPRYKLSPLKKSHSKFGFEEPIKYFDPSVGISQIIGVPDKFIKSDKTSFLVGTMGNAKKFKEGMLSLFFFEFDNGKKNISTSELIPIKSRVRDMIYVEDHNFVLMYLENNNSIGILKKIN
ncbi:PQQ-dependent sugar dehydrogenase [Candidatus Pelagibacter sp.]|nr:PQQ-dependent sugar dehydrogenase [Candidatus Pelagibacter sp.]